MWVWYSGGETGGSPFAAARLVARVAPSRHPYECPGRIQSLSLTILPPSHCPLAAASPTTYHLPPYHVSPNHHHLGQAAEHGGYGLLLYDEEEPEADPAEARVPEGTPTTPPGLTSPHRAAPHRTAPHHNYAHHTTANADHTAPPRQLPAVANARCSRPLPRLLIPPSTTTSTGAGAAIAAATNGHPPPTTYRPTTAKS